MSRMLLAQLTDTHVLDPTSDEERWVDNNARLAEAVASLNDESDRPAAVLATGDLTNDSGTGELAELARLLEPLTMPVLALPGNHDNRDQIRSVFDMPWAAADNLSWVVELDDLRIIGLDTTVPGRQYGDFDAPRREWLAQALTDTAGHPVAIAMHHPPFLSGIEWMDRSALRGIDTFVEMVAAHPHVGRIFCGHLHRPVLATVGGTTASVGLSTVHHVALDTTPGAPIELIRDPAGYQLHRFEAGAWLSHTRYIATGEKAFTPSWASEHRAG